MTKPVITTRASKGSALSYNELDTNFTNLRNSTITVNADSGSVVNELNGTMTISGGTGLTSSVSGSTVALNLDNTAVTPGSYTNANITVDQQGRITAVANGGNNFGMGSVETQTITTPGTNQLITLNLNAGYNVHIFDFGSRTSTNWFDTVIFNANAIRSDYGIDHYIMFRMTEGGSSWLKYFGVRDGQYNLAKFRDPLSIGLQLATADAKAVWKITPLPGLTWNEYQATPITAQRIWQVQDQVIYIDEDPDYQTSMYYTYIP